MPDHIHIVGKPVTPHERLIRALEAIAEVTDEQKSAIESGLKGTLREYQAHENVVRAGDRPDSCAIIVEGFTYRCHYVEKGDRQILSFHNAGDMPDVQSLYLKTMDHDVATLDRAVLLHVPHQTMFELFEKSPGLASLFWRGSLIEASIFRMWITNVAQRQAPERIAHLLCEIMTRLKAVGISDGVTCQIPLTQGDIADATGLSTVHVNRSIQKLRSDKLIQLRAGSLTIIDWDGLASLASFNPGYLHLRSEHERPVQ